MSRKPTEKEPDIHAAVDLIRQSAATGLKAVVDDVMKVCERDYAAVQTAMFLAYEEIALHALANTVLTEDDFVQAGRGAEESLRNRWRHHQAARAAATPAPEGFYKN
jgi:hypothetical protein